MTEIGPRARALSVPEAARFGEMVLVAIPFAQYASLPATALVGRIVIDAGNYYPQGDGHDPEIDAGRTTSSERLAAHLPGARVVKAFNTLNFRDLAEKGDGTLPLEERQALFLAGDDPEARRQVAALITAIGFGPVETGGLADGGRRQQPGTPLYNTVMTVREALAALATAA